MQLPKHLLTFSYAARPEVIEQFLCVIRGGTTNQPMTLLLSLPFLFRIAVIKDFKEFNKRILVSTDLVGRGIDIERVNIVINYDFPDKVRRKR